MTSSSDIHTILTTFESVTNTQSPGNVWTACRDTILADCNRIINELKEAGVIASTESGTPGMDLKNAQYVQNLMTECEDNKLIEAWLSTFERNAYFMEDSAFNFKITRKLMELIKATVKFDR